jgi:hypothetical protein
VIPAAIGTADNRLFAEWLVDNGLQPYTPQVHYGDTANLAWGWLASKGRMEWSAESIALAQRCAHPLVMNYHPYFYDTNWGTVRWQHFPYLNQDTLSLEIMTVLLADQRDWFVNNGMPNAWVLVDEPPPKANADRWSQQIENRIIKFVQALTYAGWPVRVAVPGPSQYNYWRAWLPESTGWILHCKNDDTDYERMIDAPSGKSLWLYNKQGTYNGLADMIERRNASGYLVWDGISTSSANPALWDERTNEPTIHAGVLLDELALIDDTAPEPPKPPNELNDILLAIARLDERVTRIETCLDNLRRTIAASLSEVNE